MKKVVLIIMLFAAEVTLFEAKAKVYFSQKGGVPIGAKWCSKHSAYDICWKTATTPKPRF